MLQPMPLRQYLAALGSRGVHERDVFADTGIAPESASAPHQLIHIDQYRGVFENMARLDLAGGVGLEIGLGFRELGHFGVLGHAALSCKSPRQALEEFLIRFGDRQGLMGRPELRGEISSAVVVQFVVPLVSEAAYRVCIEESLCRLAIAAPLVSGEEAPFQEIRLAYPEPAYANRYREIFRCPVHFGAHRTVAFIRRSWLEKSIPTHDEGLHGFYLEHVRQLDRSIQQNSSVVDQAREVLLRHGGDKPPSQTETAETLGMSSRNLCRLLDRENSSYRQLLEDLRMERVLMRMQHRPVSSKELAYWAGYRDVNAFRRAFKNWTGTTVGAYRTRALLDGGELPPEEVGSSR